MRVTSMLMGCSAALDVPEGLRETALAFPHSEKIPVIVPDRVTCEIDRHPFGDHAALLLDLGPDNEGAAWVTWCEDGNDVKVHRKTYCPSRSPVQEDACWLYSQHRGGHSWERFE